jgi:hypothetical protein
MSKDHSSWRNQNRYWQAITDGIRASLKKLQESPAFRAKRARRTEHAPPLSERER